jgi:hypothetical protein
MNVSFEIGHKVELSKRRKIATKKTQELTFGCRRHLILNSHGTSGACRCQTLQKNKRQEQV